MNKRTGFQIAAVVAIIVIACVLMKVVPGPELPPVVPEKPPPPLPTSALFETDLLSEWSPPPVAGSTGRMLVGTEWAAQSALPLPLGPCAELIAGAIAEIYSSIDLVAQLDWLFLSMTNWDAVSPAAAVGAAAGPAGPLAAVASLASGSHTRAAFVEQGADSGVVVWASRTTNISADQSTCRKTYRDKFLGRADDADRAMRAFRERLEVKARQLGAEVHDPAETVRENRLVGFAFEYALGAARGRVEAVVEPGLSADYQLRAEVEETPE